MGLSYSIFNEIKGLEDRGITPFNIFSKYYISPLLYPFSHPPFRQGRGDFLAWMVTD